MSLAPVEDDADAFVAPAAMVVPLTAPALPSSSASSAIKAGSPIGFGYSALSGTEQTLLESLQQQDAAAKDMLYKITGKNEVWVRTVSDPVGGELKDGLQSNDYKRKIWVTALSPHVHVCFLAYKCGGVFQVEDRQMDHIMKLKVWPREARTSFSKEKPWLWEVVDPSTKLKAGQVDKSRWMIVLVGFASLMPHVYAVGSRCPPSSTRTRKTRKHTSSEWPSDTTVTAVTTPSFCLCLSAWRPCSRMHSRPRSPTVPPFSVIAHPYAHCSCCVC